MFFQNKKRYNHSMLYNPYAGVLAVMTLCILMLMSCKKNLDINPKGTLSEEQINTPDGAEKLAIAAYASLGNDHSNTPFSLWPYGDVRSDDAYKGGNDENDGQTFHFIETFYNTRTDFSEVDGLWYLMYIGISRANAALNALESLDESSFKLKNQRIAEMRFLRGHWYFQLKIMFKYMPYIDENVPRDNYANIGNRELSNEQLWDKIADDFQFAADNLPDNKTDLGRPDKIAAYAYLAKTRLYQAYQQNEKNTVTSIDQQHLNEVISATDKVLGSSYHLESDFANNFLPGTYENGVESIWAIQYSNSDGTMFGRLNYSDALSVPQGIGCCDFKKPSQNLVNAFKTDANGLPLLDTYNSSDVNVLNDNIDPRLDHTVALAGRTWKYDPAYIYQNSWNRSPAIYGNYASLKENVSPSCECFVHLDPFYANSKNRIILRYADVLLMRAEALNELGNQGDALSLVNQIRQRAANSTAMLKDVNGNFEGHYNVGLYVAGSNIAVTQENVRKAIRFERRLEMAEEGSRFFDLVRWGIADQVLNDYFNIEKTKWSFLKNAYFTKMKNEYLPIPLNQINFSKSLYQQNYGY